MNASHKQFNATLGNEHGLFDCQASAVVWAENRKHIFRVSIYKNEKLIYIGYTQVSGKSGNDIDIALHKYFRKQVEDFGGV